MEKTYKRVPFNLELGRCIIKGKADGRVGEKIETVNGKEKLVKYIEIAE